MIRVAITDDHPLVLQGLNDMLKENEQMQVVAQWSDSSATFTEINLHQVDVLLLDVNLPREDGISLCKRLKKLHTNLAILGLSSHEDLSVVKAMMRAGANGFLLKTVDEEELCKAIVQVAKGEEYVQIIIERRLLNQAMGKPAPTHSIPTLTRREKEVLDAISEELTSAEIAEKLFISPKTVESHRAMLFQKLGVRNAAGLIRVAMEKGLI